MDHRRGWMCLHEVHGWEGLWDVKSGGVFSLFSSEELETMLCYICYTGVCSLALKKCQWVFNCLKTEVEALERYRGFAVES